MDWKSWIGKKVFVKTKSSGVYSGEVIDVDDRDKNIIFISMIDKFGQRVMIVHSEIIKIIEVEK